MYCMDGRVRYSEIDADGIITTDALVNYLQDCVMLHSEAVGRGVRAVSAGGLKGYWLMASWQIEILRPLRYYEVIKVVTTPYEFKGFFGGRNVEILDAEQKKAVAANSMWVYIDAATGVPDRVPEDEAQIYAPLGVKSDMKYLPRKITLPDGLKSCPAIAVTPDMIDTNKHVNNCEYVRAAMCASGIYSLPATLRVEYKQAAVLGDDFCPWIYRDDRHCVVDLRGRDGTAFAVVEFIL